MSIEHDSLIYRNNKIVAYKYRQMIRNYFLGMNVFLKDEKLHTS